MLDQAQRLSFWRRNKLVILALVAALCGVLAVVTHHSEPSLNIAQTESFATGIDWSTHVNEPGTLPTASGDDVARLRIRLQVIAADRLPQPVVHVPPLTPNERTMLVVARISSTNSHDYALASVGGSFYQRCLLLEGGTVTQLTEDELTYMVVYTPPQGAHLTADECQGNEVFFLAKKPQHSGSE